MRHFRPSLVEKNRTIIPSTSQKKFKGWAEPSGHFALLPPLVAPFWCDLAVTGPLRSGTVLGTVLGPDRRGPVTARSHQNWPPRGGKIYV